MGDGSMSGALSRSTQPLHTSSRAVTLAVE